MLDYEMIYTDNKPVLTAEDKSLKWQPIISPVEICPHCYGPIGDYGTWTQVDSRPWAQEYIHDGFICYNCHAKIPEDETKKAWLKSYSAYGLYSAHEMTQEDYNWFTENNIKDIRLYVSEEKEK
jgi:hypothetical protein